MNINVKNYQRSLNVMKFIYILLLLICPTTVLAAPVTPDAALKRLSGQNFSRIRGLSQAPLYRISKILTDSCGNNTVYLFDSEDGFVVSPADDAIPAVLGYGDGEVYDSAGNLPIGFREWLQYMSLRVSEVAAGDNVAIGSTSVGEAIAPLCTTLWGARRSLQSGMSRILRREVPFGMRGHCNCSNNEISQLASTR